MKTCKYCGYLQERLVRYIKEDEGLRRLDNEIIYENAIARDGKVEELIDIMGGIG